MPDAKPDPWIEDLAEEIRLKNRDAAEDFARTERASAIIAEKGKPFFVSLIQCLQQNVDGLRSQLQGDPVAADTGVQTVRSCEIRITRARFPFVDATVEHTGETISLVYAKSPNTSANPAAPDRQTRTFAFRVIPDDDTLLVTDTFAAAPVEFSDAPALARHITELLFCP